MLICGLGVFYTLEPGFRPLFCHNEIRAGRDHSLLPDRITIFCSLF